MVFSGSLANTIVIEILVILAVVKAFRAMAVLKGLNKVLWAWIGGLSYYVSVLVFSLIILPILSRFRFIPEGFHSTLNNIKPLLNLAVGIICCGGTYLYLKSKPNVTSNTDLDIID